jgi:polysaccharide export outer membrane protein
MNPRHEIKHYTEIYFFRMVVTALLIVCSGCGLFVSDAVVPSEQVQLEAFENAGTARLTLDREAIYRNISTKEHYRIVREDLLEIQMPSLLGGVTDDLVETGRLEQVQKFLCRVNENGVITLPIVGDVPVADKTLPEAETTIREAYFPNYVVSPPTVVSQVVDYKKYYVSITGAVNKPGTYSMRHDQMSLVSLLMEAGGIVESGAAYIQICKADGTQAEQKDVMLPVEGLNIPFADMTLHEGDIVEVHRIQEQVFTVIGLVNKQGTFPYPSQLQYNLPEALAIAGGLNQTADPHYIRIYRPGSNGQVLDAVFDIQPGKMFSKLMHVHIKSGDVIAVEQTPRTRGNLLIADILQLRASVGMNYQP